MSGFNFDPWGKETNIYDGPVQPPWDDDEPEDPTKVRADQEAQDRADRVKVRADLLRGQLLDHDGLHRIPPPTSLVADILDRNTLAWLHGKPGHAKTFVAVDLACCIATGLAWQGHDTTQGPVVYVIAEGAAGLSARVDAWTMASGQPPAGVLFLPVPVQLLDAFDLSALVALLADLRPALLVIDTQARVTVGAEENSSRDMGRLVEALEWLRRDSGACLLVVHHEPRNGENLRGHSTLEGAATTVIRASKDGSLVTVEVLKQKDHPAPPALRLALTPLKDSCVLYHHDGVGDILAGSAIELLQAMWESFGTDATSATAVRNVSPLSQSSHYRALKTLVDRGAVVKEQRGRASFYALADQAEQMLPS